MVPTSIFRTNLAFPRDQPRLLSAGVVLEREPYAAHKTRRLLHAAAPQGCTPTAEHICKPLPGRVGNVPLLFDTFCCPCGELVSQRAIMQLCGWDRRSTFERHNIVDEAELGDALTKRYGTIAAQSEAPPDETDAVTSSRSNS